MSKKFIFSIGVVIHQFGHIQWEAASTVCVGGVDISADGQYVVAVGQLTTDGIAVFDRTSGTPFWETSANFAFVSISADGEYFVVGYHTGNTEWKW